MLLNKSNNDNVNGLRIIDRKIQQVILDDELKIRKNVILSQINRIAVNLDKEKVFFEIKLDWLDEFWCINIKNKSIIIKKW